MRYLLIILAFVCLSLSGRATHIVGGELYYECLGNNDYLFTLKVYRDCSPGITTPFDANAIVSFWDSTNAFIQSELFTFPGSVQLPAVVNNPCLVVPPNVCVEEAVYTKIVNLPPIPGGYTVAYQRCCRNNSIINLVNPGTWGGTYLATIPDSALASCNSSPYFNNFPPIAICVGDSIQFDHSASDPDGDSLVYSFCDPLHGASQPVPVVNQFAPPPPPFTPVMWNTGYSTTYPLAASLPFEIDSVTGLLTGVANTVGQFVVGVCAQEYRNGVLIGEARRDFQFNVTICNLSFTASFLPQATYCEDLVFDFQNTTTTGSSFLWDFGETSLSTDTSTQVNPTHQFADTGTYTVTLTVNPGFVCADSATHVFEVYSTPIPKIIPPDTVCFTGHSFDFAPLQSWGPQSDYLWDFGPFANLPSSTDSTPSGIQFATPGEYPVSLEVQNSGCTGTWLDTVLVADPIPGALTTDTFCYDNHSVDFSFQETPHPDVQFVWDFGPFGVPDSTTTPNPQGVMWSQPGSHVYTVTGSHFACTETWTDSLYLVDPTSRIVEPDTQCFDGHSFDFIMLGDPDNDATYTWNFGATASTPTSNLPEPTGITWATDGQYPISLTTEIYGCTHIENLQAVILPEPKLPSAELPPIAGCAPLTVQFPGNAIDGTVASILWDFGDGTQSPLASPEYTYDVPGTYDVGLRILPFETCMEEVEFSWPNLITVYPVPEAAFTMSHELRTIRNPDFTFYDESMGGLLCDVSMGDGAWYNDCGTIEHTYADSGNYTVTQIVTTGAGCADTAMKVIRVDPEYLLFIPNTFTPNGDGINDRFNAVVYGAKTYELTIYDRWGELIFSSTDQSEGWNGQVKGRSGIAPTGVYIYRIQITDVFNKTHRQLGHVTLLK